MKKGMLLVLLLLLLGGSLSACHTLNHRPPGHDPNGPGNSENAPGHNK